MSIPANMPACPAGAPVPDDRGHELAADAAAGQDTGAAQGEPARQVRIELSQAQVDEVIRSAVEARSISSVLAGLGESSQVLRDAYREVQAAGRNHLSTSLLSGLLVLACFPADGAPVSNIEIARQLGLSPSTTYRYLSTLVVAGLVEKHSDKRLYRLAR